MKIVNVLISSFLLLLVTISALSVSYSLKAGLADFSTLKARARIIEYQQTREKIDPVSWQELEQAFIVASENVPDSPIYYQNLAYLYATRGIASVKFPDISVPYFEKATIKYLSAIRVRPMSAGIWANLALGFYFINPNSADVGKSFDVAMFLGAKDSQVQLILINFYKFNWVEFTDKRKENLFRSFSDSKDPKIQEINKTLIK